MTGLLSLTSSTLDCFLSSLPLTAEVTNSFKWIHEMDRLQYIKLIQRVCWEACGYLVTQVAALYCILGCIGFEAQAAWLRWADVWFTIFDWYYLWPLIHKLLLIDFLSYSSTHFTPSLSWVSRILYSESQQWSDPQWNRLRGCSDVRDGRLSMIFIRDYSQMTYTIADYTLIKGSISIALSQTCSLSNRLLW